MNDERCGPARSGSAIAETLRRPQVILGIVLWGSTAALLLLLSAVS
jgi:hypothetical protein